MCSVSWKEVDQNILIAFNRDEQKDRAIASPPQISKKKGVSFIMPKDPQGGGSWISVNQFGVMLGILNLYEYDRSFKGLPDNNHFVSRGDLINQLCLVRCEDEVSLFFEQVKLSKYRPFRFIFITSKTKFQFVWNGKELNKLILPSFISSSSWNSRHVIERRCQQFYDSGVELDKTASIESLIELHQSHSIQKDAYSICMHRKDAKTVSLSAINIGPEKVLYRYWDGSPCEVEESKSLSVSLINNTK